MLFYFSILVDKNCSFVIYFYYAHQLFFNMMLLFVNF